MKQNHTEKNSKKRDKRKRYTLWAIKIFVLTIVISGVFSYISNLILDSASLAAAFIILFLIVLLGVIFDILGVAVTVAEETPFHSMAAKKIPEAPYALKMLRNASHVSSICNDVIGDICGVISGAAAAIIAVEVYQRSGLDSDSIIKLVLSAVVAGLTVGGKAVGKAFAINEAVSIIHLCAKLQCFLATTPEKVLRLITHNKR